MPKLTQERLKELLRYDMDTGLFYWRKSSGRAKAGSVAGWEETGVIIRVDGRKYPAHHLACLYVTGRHAVPRHLNGDRYDNRWQNLDLSPPPRWVSLSRLREVLQYDGKEFYWRIDKGGYKAGQRVLGREIMIDGLGYRRARLTGFYITGQW